MAVHTLCDAFNTSRASSYIELLLLILYVNIYIMVCFFVKDSTTYLMAIIIHKVSQRHSVITPRIIMISVRICYAIVGIFISFITRFSDGDYNDAETCCDICKWIKKMSIFILSCFCNFIEHEEELEKYIE